jgi:hypothetical protein
VLDLLNKNTLLFQTPTLPSLPNSVSLSPLGAQTAKLKAQEAELASLRGASESAAAAAATASASTVGEAMAAAAMAAAAATAAHVEAQHKAATAALTEEQRTAVRFCFASCGAHGIFFEARVFQLSNPFFLLLLVLLNCCFSALCRDRWRLCAPG